MHATETTDIVKSISLGQQNQDTSAIVQAFQGLQFADVQNRENISKMMETVGQAMKELFARLDSQQSRLTLAESQLQTAMIQKEETKQAFEAYKVSAEQQIKLLNERVDRLSNDLKKENQEANKKIQKQEEEVAKLNQRYSTHSHPYYYATNCGQVHKNTGGPNSNEEKIDLPRPLAKPLKYLKKASRNYSRKDKGSKNRRKLALKLSRLDRKCHNVQVILRNVETSIGTYCFYK